MAVKPVTVTALSNGVAATLAEGAVEGTCVALNGSTDTLTITGANESRRLLIVINNTTAGSKKVTIKKGTENPPAIRKGLGDLVITLAEKTQQVVAVESARFAKPDGTIEVSCEAATTGFLQAFRLPLDI